MSKIEERERIATGLEEIAAEVRKGIVTAYCGLLVIDGQEDFRIVGRGLIERRDLIVELEKMKFETMFPGQIQ